MNFSAWQLVLAVLGALFIGVSKTGVGGLGVLASAIFVLVMPEHAKQATGVVLPMLIFGDIVAVASYRRHAQWRHIVRMFPWTAAGIVLGWLAMGRMDDRQARLLIGGIVLALTALQLVRRRRGADLAVPGAWFGPVLGVLAGFTTLVANAAGAIMAVYLLAMRLPKLEFVGTAAVFFLAVNLLKVPFMANLGLLTSESFSFNLLLAPVVFAGTLGGRWLLPRLDQRAFENVTLALGGVAGGKLLLG
jgi:uncharacterized membrane protein YfcA